MAAPSVVGGPTAAIGAAGQTLTLGAAGVTYAAVVTEAQNLPQGLTTLISDATSGWTAIVGTSGGAGHSANGLYDYVFTKSTAASATIDTGDSGVFNGYDWITVDASGGVEAVTTGTGTTDASGVFTVPGITTLGADRLVVGFVFPRIDSATEQIGTGTWTNAGLSGLTAITPVQTSQGSGGGIAGFYGVKSAAGATGNTTVDSSRATANSMAFNYAIFAIKPVGGATITGASVMAATGAMAASGTRKTFGAATMSAAGSSSASGARKTFGAATLSAAGSSSASGVRKTYGASTLSATGSSSASGTRKTFGASVLSASGSMAAAGVRSAFGAATMSIAAALAAAGARTTFGAATLNAVAAFIASSPDESEEWPQDSGTAWASSNDDEWPAHSGNSWES